MTDGPLAALSRIGTIAVNTFREARRNRVVYGIVVLVVLANVASLGIGEMSLHEEARVARDTAVAGVSFFGVITAVYLGVSMLYTEIQKKTVHVMLAKPIERHEFVLGKYAGMGLSLTFLTALFAVTLMGQVELGGAHPDANLARAIVLAYAEVMLVAAIAVFFSSFSSPYLSGIFTVCIWVIGRISDEIEWVADKGKNPLARLGAEVALRLVPDMRLFSPSGGTVESQHVSVHKDFVDWAYVSHAGAYALLWIGLLLLLAAVIFRRRDFV